jgi:hypothetical protein
MNEYAMDRQGAMHLMQGEENHGQWDYGSMAGNPKPQEKPKNIKPCILGLDAPVWMCIDSLAYKTKCYPRFTGSKGREFPETIMRKKIVPPGYVTVNAAHHASSKNSGSIKSWAMKGMVRTVKSIGHLYVCLEDVLDLSGGKNEQG